MHLIHKAGVVGELEVAVAMGLQVEHLEPPMDGGLGDTRVIPGRGRFNDWWWLADPAMNAVLSTSATRSSSWV